VRFTGEDLSAMTLAAEANNQTVSQWVRSAVRHSFRWIVECKDCHKEFTFHFVDPGHPREAVNNALRRATEASIAEFGRRENLPSLQSQCHLQANRFAVQGKLGHDPQIASLDR